MRVQTAFIPYVVREAAVGDRDSRPHEANLFDLAAKYAEVVCESDIAGLIESRAGWRAHKSIARQPRDTEAMNAMDAGEFPRGEIDPERIAPQVTANSPASSSACANPRGIRARCYRSLPCRNAGGEPVSVRLADDQKHRFRARDGR